LAQSTFVQDALPIVIVAVVIVAGLVAVALAFSARGTYDQIGRSGMSFDREAPQSTNDPADLEQLLAATNARRAARGREPLSAADFEAPPDDALRAEIRAFVESRNARRVARGQPPLDVEAEVERRLSGQDG
jgi:hypothetical protein